VTGDLRHDLAAWRARLGITQAEAATSLDVPLRTYQGWEAGRAVERETIVKLALWAIEEKSRKAKNRR
jgi:DNA-binding XRE family transcriptional regulator